MKDSGQKQDMQEQKEVQDQIRESGQVIVENGKGKPRIYILSVIGEIEGHENLSGSSKTTKYEHVLPKLAEIEGDDDVDGILLLINTVGGDVSCGLALAEMVASLSKPTVSLVIGDSHSIRRAAGGGVGSVLYRAHGNHDDSSGAHDRHGHRRGADLRIFPDDRGPDHFFCGGAFQGGKRAPESTDAQHENAHQGSGNRPGGA